MRNRSFIVALLLFALTVPVAAQTGQSQYPAIDKLAQKVIDKYQNSSCADLAAQKQAPPSAEKAGMEKRAMQMLHQNPDMRTYFINKVAGPVANKMFECGMIP